MTNDGTVIFALVFGLTLAVAFLKSSIEESTSVFVPAFATAFAADDNGGATATEFSTDTAADTHPLQCRLVLPLMHHGCLGSGWVVVCVVHESEQGVKKRFFLDDVAVHL